MRKKFGDIVIGLLFVAVGVIFAGRMLFDWEFTVFYPGWWTIFIIVPCIASMISNKINFGNLFGLGVGIILFMGANNIFFDMAESWKLIVPLLLVIIGISIIFKKNNTGNYIEEQKNIKTNGPIPEFSAVFSGNDYTATQGETFNGANCSAVFGGVDLKLYGASITEDVIINCSTVFGGADIYLPPNVKVKVTQTPIFGGIENRHNDCIDAGAPTVYINGTCIFGGIDVH